MSPAAITNGTNGDHPPTPEVTKPGEIGFKCEYKIYHEQQGKLPGAPPERKSLAKLSDLKSYIPGSADEDAACAFIATQKYSDKGERDKVVLKIQSPLLLKAFRDVVASYPTVPNTFQYPFELESPFHMLLHYWDELHAYAKSAEDEDVRKHLDLLFEFMDVELGEERSKFLAMVNKGQITYKTLWQVFRPGDLVYKDESEHPWLLTCVKTAYETNKCDGPFLEVHCTYTDFDGKALGNAEHMVRIIQKQFFGGDNPANIASLPCYPRKFVQAGPDLEETLEKRGRKFLGIRDVTVKYYSGLASYLKEPPMNFFHSMLEKKSGLWIPFTVCTLLFHPTLSLIRKRSWVQRATGRKQPYTCRTMRVLEQKRLSRPAI
jgi:hypothetical protein